MADVLDNRLTVFPILFCGADHPIEDKATAYVRQNFVCQLPTNDLAVLSNLLDTGKSPPNDNSAKQDAGKQ